MLERYRKSLERGTAAPPESVSFDALLASPVKGKKSETNLVGENPNLNSAALLSEGGESAMDSAGSEAVSAAAVAPDGTVPGTVGSGGEGGQPRGGEPEMGPAASGGNIPKGRWKGKLWSEMGHEERLKALADRKKQHQDKIDERDQTQADWVRCIHPVVNDEDPAGFQRILKTMGISEDRIRQQSVLLGKLLGEGQKTLALLLWCQARDSKNQLIRYLTGHIAHEVNDDGSSTPYDPEVAMQDSSMKVKVLQLLKQLGSVRTRREEAAEQQLKAAELAKKQARWAKNPTNPNRKGGKRKGEGGASASAAPSAPKQQKPASKQKSPSGDQQPTKAGGKKRYLNNSSLILDSETNSKKADLQSSSEKQKLKQSTDEITKQTRNLSLAEAKPTSNLLFSDKDVLEDGGVEASYAAALNNPFKNPQTVRVLRYTTSDDGVKDFGPPGMSKEHFEGKVLPELEQLRRKVNLARIQQGESPFKAARASKFVKGKPDSRGNLQPNFGLIVPFDEVNAMWLTMQVDLLQLQQGSEGEVYRYKAAKAFEAGKGTVILSFKVAKLGSDVSVDSWENYCYDNAIDSTQTKLMEPRYYPGCIEVVFAATKDLVQKLRTTDVTTGRQAGHFAFGMQGMKELQYKTKPLLSKSMDQLDFVFGHL